MEGRENAAVTGARGGGGGGDNLEGLGGGAAAAEKNEVPSPTPPPQTAVGQSAAGGMGAAAPPVGTGTGTMEMMRMMGVVEATGSGGELVRKKRGRPRKYRPEGSGMALVLSPTSPFSPKQGRGRPSGSGKRQLFAALGEWFALSAGGSFTPHVVTIATGEDVAARILSFSQKGPRSICILSANGAISNVTLRQPGSSGGTLTYEGRFEILSLSGSFTITENGGARSQTGGISISLAGPDGRVLGGGVAGLLLAASPIQVVVGSFVSNIPKEPKKKADPETSTSPAIPTSGVLTAARPISQVNPDDVCETPTSAVQGKSHGRAEDDTSNNPNTNSASFNGMGWQGLQSLSEHKPSPDINISLPGE